MGRLMVTIMEMGRGRMTIYTMVATIGRGRAPMYKMMNTMLRERI